MKGASILFGLPGFGLRKMIFRSTSSDISWHVVRELPVDVSFKQ